MAEPVPHSPAIAPEFTHKSARFRDLDRYDRYLKGTQYEGRPDFFTGRKPNGDVVPLRERKPVIIYPLPRNGVREAVRFTYGEGRFPSLQVKPVDKDDAVGSLAVSADEAKAIEKGVAEITEQARLRAVMRTLLEHGLGKKTGVAIVCVREGRYVIDTPRGQDCSPSFKNGDPTAAVVGLTVCYQFDKEVADQGTGEPKLVKHWYRRDITETHDIRYHDAAVVQGVRPVWKVDETQTSEHALGFCPVVWYRNLPDAECGSIDGTSLLDGNFDEFDALNFALSQRHRGITFFGVPQPYETGVADDDGPQATERTSMGGPAGFSGGRTPAPFGGVCATSPARASSPDRIWSYRAADVQVGLIETTGKAFEVATKHVDDISARIKQSMSVVLANAADVLGKGDMSAKFLALVYAPLLALVDDLRECSWSGALEPILAMALRILMVREGKGILIPRAPELAAILKKRTVTTEAGPVWVAPKVTPVWGAYFSASNDDIKVATETAAKAREAKVLSAKDATAFLAAQIGIRDVATAHKDAAAPSLEDGLNFKTLDLGSETLDAAFYDALARAAAPGLEDADYKKIASELHQAHEQARENAALLREQMKNGGDDGDEQQAERDDREAGSGEPSSDRESWADEDENGDP